MGEKLKATVTVQLGITKNLGNYESARYDVALTVEGEKGTEDELYDYAKTWVSTRIKDAKVSQE